MNIIKITNLVSPPKVIFSLLVIYFSLFSHLPDGVVPQGFPFLYMGDDPAEMNRAVRMMEMRVRALRRPPRAITHLSNALNL